MSRSYQRYRQRSANQESAAEQDRRHREAMAAIDGSAEDAVMLESFRRGTTLLQVDDLVVEKGRNGAGRRVVDGVSFTVGYQECVGIRGEAGSGKSTLGLALMGLAPAVSGGVTCNGVDLFGGDLPAYRTEAQLVFQDARSALSPRRRAGRAIAEAIRLVHPVSRKEAAGRARDLLEAAGLEAGDGERCPHELSPGEARRVCIARALAVEPRLLVVDGPLDGLEADEIEPFAVLLRDLGRDRKLTMLFLARDLGPLGDRCHRILSMAGGRLVDPAEADAEPAVGADESA